MPFALLPLYALAGVGAGGSVVIPIMMIRAFPASIRFSGVSFSYNLAYVEFANWMLLDVGNDSHAIEPTKCRRLN
jgi:hypothetical protein